MLMPGARQECLADDDQHVDIGVQQVDQIILTVYFLDVAVVGEGPACGPSVNELERISAEPEIAAADEGDAEGVLTAEMGAKFFFINMTAAAIARVTVL